MMLVNQTRPVLFKCTLYHVTSRPHTTQITFTDSPTGYSTIQPLSWHRFIYIYLCFCPIKNLSRPIIYWHMEKFFNCCSSSIAFFSSCLLLMMLILAQADQEASLQKKIIMSREYNENVEYYWSEATMSTSINDDDGGSGGGLSRRSLFWNSFKHIYISYGALSSNRIPCPPRSGRSYYTHNCYFATGPVHPYVRGCSTITRCRR